ncbi:UV excision repair protein rad23 [Microbotryomycetes sp. JL221]|nr:UV excision repair protein rad23 [Microbotryomycetes sp. JL221]
MMRVKITFKTLQQKQFVLEAEPTETFLDVKRKIEKDQGFSVESQKIIFSGKIQPDDKTVGDANFKDKDFCVVMVSKPKPTPAAPATPAPATAASTATASSSTSSSAPATAALAPLETPAQASAPAVAPNAPAPAPPSSSTLASSPAETPSQSNQPGSSNSFLMGSQLEESVQNMMAMGFPREQIMKAMRASFNNPDRAVDYLLNGIPETSTQDAPPSAPSSAAPGTPSPASGNTASLAQSPAPASTTAPRNLFEAAAAQSRAPSTGSTGATTAAATGAGAGAEAAQQPQSTGELAALANQPVFAQLRQLVQQNPALLQPFLQQLGQSNPELLQMIDRNQADFIRFLQEGTENEDDGDFDDLMGQMGEGGEGGPGGEQFIQVTEEEKAAIDRLCAMGFERGLVIQAYIACDRNEELAANYLLEHGYDDDD